MSKKSKYYISFLLETILIIFLFLDLFKSLLIHDYVNGITVGTLSVIISLVCADLIFNIFDFIDLIKGVDSDGSEEIQSDIHDAGD